MKIIAISDEHGYLPMNLPAGDILISAGDEVPIENHSIEYQEKWLDTTFRKWLEFQSNYFGHIIGIAGNHSFIFEMRPEFVPEGLKWTYLQDSGITIDGINFWGSPHQPIFHNWAFNLSEKDLAKKFALIPDNTNILVTHGPPRGILDWAPHEKIIGRRENAGSTSLRDRVLQLPNLKHHIFGHLHQNYGQRKIGDTLFSCVSIMNEGYRPVNPATVITI